MGLGTNGSKIKPPRKHDRRYPELTVPGDKVQIDVKEVPYACLRGDLQEYGKHLYQWTAIDECTRVRFVYGFEEHTPENTVKFFKMLEKAFPFKIQKVQTDNETELTYKYISEDVSVGRKPPFRARQKSPIMVNLKKPTNSQGNSVGTHA